MGNSINCRDIDIGDICCVNSCYTSRQQLGFAGTRYGKRGSRTGELAWPHFYIVLERRIYSTQIPFVPQPGSEIWQVRDTSPCGKYIGCLGRSYGRYCWLLLWTDIVGYGGSSLYCYAQSCDMLIEEWQEADGEICS